MGQRGIKGNNMNKQKYNLIFIGDKNWNSAVFIGATIEQILSHFGETIESYTGLNHVDTEEIIEMINSEGTTLWEKPMVLDYTEVEVPTCLEGETLTVSKSIGGNTAGIAIGKNDAGGNLDNIGYLDCIRISKGIARWTSDFTPPLRAYI